MHRKLWLIPTVSGIDVNSTHFTLFFDCLRFQTNMSVTVKPTLDCFSFSIAGSAIEARERKIGGAIYRGEVDWSSNAKLQLVQKPLESAAAGLGKEYFTLNHEVVNGKRFQFHLLIQYPFSQPIEHTFELEEVKRTEVDTLKEMLEAQEERLEQTSSLHAELQDAATELRKQVESSKNEITKLSQEGVEWKELATDLRRELDATKEATSELRNSLAEVRKELTLQSELAAKSEKVSYPFVSLSSTIACGNGSMIQWNNTISLPAANFALSGDQRQITTLSPGLYHVYVRVPGTNSGNGQQLGLQKNGSDLATCVQSDANGHQNTAQLTEILNLKANDKLQVRSHFNSNSLANAAGSRFVIVLLQKSE